MKGIKKWYKHYRYILLTSLIIYISGYFFNTHLFQYKFFSDYIPWGPYNLSIGDMCFFTSLSLILSTLWSGNYEKK